MSLPLLQESVWFDKCKFDDAERQFYESRVQNNSGGQRTISKSAQKRAKKRNKLLTQEVAVESPPVSPSVSEVTKSSLAAEIAKARKHIQNSLQSPNETTSLPAGGCGDAATVCQDLNVRLVVIEQENVQLRQVAKSLQDVLSKLEGRISLLENLTRSLSVLTAVPSTPLSQAIHSPQVAPSTQAAQSPQLVSSSQAETNGVIDDEDDIDLFGSDEDDEEADKLRQDRLKAYEEKKAKKPILIAKSNIILDVKPWDDETDMKEIEKCVRSIQTDGLLWGASKLVPLAYGINKLQIGCVVEDDKVGTDFLEENITAFEELVQSVDIVAFNKI